VKTILFIASLVLSITAQGHILLSSPSPRPPNSDNLKQDANNPDPCGSRQRGSSPIVYTPNQMVTFQFTETIEHPGRFKVQFSRTGDEGFGDAENLLAVLEDTNDADTEFTMNAKMPNLECDNCTLRLIQEMDEQPGQIYVNCVDIQLKGEAIAGQPELSAPESPVAGDEGSSESGTALNDSEKKLPQMSGCGRVSAGSGIGGSGGLGSILLILTLPFLLLLPLRFRADIKRS